MIYYKKRKKRAFVLKQCGFILFEEDIFFFSIQIPFNKSSCGKIFIFSVIFLHILKENFFFWVFVYEISNSEEFFFTIVQVSAIDPKKILEKFTEMRSGR